MIAKSFASLSLVAALSACALPQEFRKNGFSESSSAFGIERGMTRIQANKLISDNYKQFRFIYSTCLRSDYPNVPMGTGEKTFGTLQCLEEGQDVYHAYSGTRTANIFVVFKGDQVTRLRWEGSQLYFPS